MKDIFKRIRSFLRKWSEFVGLIIAFIIFCITPPLLRLVDNTAGSFDIGIIQAGILTLVIAFMFQSLNWLMLKVNFPNIFEYVDSTLEQEIKTIQTWSRIKYSLYLYFAPLLIMAILFLALMM